MVTARMQMSFEVPIEKVWEVLIDYPGYARFPRVQAARLVTPGREHRFGLGAVREVKVMGSTFQEEIVEFEPPHTLGYRIIKTRGLKLVHDGARVKLTARGNATDLDWETTFTVGVPVIGGALAYPVRFMLRRTFMQILRWLKRDLEGQAARAA